MKLFLSFLLIFFIYILFVFYLITYYSFLIESDSNITEKYYYYLLDEDLF